MKRGMRVLFFGMECSFSRPPLAALLAADGIEVCAVVLPRAPGALVCGDPIRLLAPPTRRRRELPLQARSTERGVVGMARAAHIPVYDAGRLADARTLTTLAVLRPDVIVVACFPRLLPPALLRLPRHGAFNIHPSLLPRYRGPSPLFWIFHDGLEHAGVTVHAMDAGADTGDIVAQAPLTLPDGISYADAEQRCAEEGARLALGALHTLAMGLLSFRPQSTAGVSYAPAPREDDFVVTPDWPARRAFNFMRGLAGWDQPLQLSVDGRRLIVREAIAFDPDETMDAPIQRHGSWAKARCSPGTLSCSLRDICSSRG